MPFKMRELGDVVLLAGRNGSGKSRLLKLLTRSLEIERRCVNGGAPGEGEEADIMASVELKFQGNEKENLSHDELLRKLSLINYSHYDVPLQTPDQFTPYVISVSRSNLERCDFEETARDVLLFIQYISKYCPTEEGQVDEFTQFKELLFQVAGLELGRDEAGNPSLFGRELKNAALSPGQQYLLRMCAALYCNRLEDDNFILFLDEPETHLHPEALWKVMEKIQERFGRGQIWIATHSVALLSMFDPAAIWHMEPGEVIKRMGSKSAPLIEGLLGDEYRRYQLQQFVTAPDLFACNCFAAECLTFPESKPVQPGDPQVELVKDTVKEQQIELRGSRKTVVVDYGAGKGRLIEGIGIDYPDYLDKLVYHAYNKYSDDAKSCKESMERYGISSESNYFEDVKLLMDKLKGNTDKVFLVNVLHEIHPRDWTEVFETVERLLNDNGELIVVELEEFTYGEKPYDSGFLVLQPEAVELLNCEEKVIFDRHPTRNHIIRYRIPKNLISRMDQNTVVGMVQQIEMLAVKRIKEIRKKEDREYKRLPVAFKRRNSIGILDPTVH